ncbi:hypothetical protein GCM10009112_19420 [Marinomonas arenicola]|uniref:Fis family transcriptional regulator n=1 Tax=Marinomonas TaxID=28253 RepID=UPI001055B83A|nr:Fis family transcriptional regulator [Marinomonas sp. KMM3893]
MKKSDKKLDKALREALTKVCDHLLGEVEGFVWLTHVVDFNRYPQSLKIVCVFEKEADVAELLSTQGDVLFYQCIEDELKGANLVIKNSRQSVSFDSEEACERSHKGRWNLRLKGIELH